MFYVEDPRTGEKALISDHDAYSKDMAAARPPVCEHKATEVRRWTNANGAVVVQAQCLDCGTRHGNQQKVVDRDAYPDADPTLRDKWKAKDLAAIHAVRIRHIDLTAKGLDARTQEYNAYIASDAWRLKREKVLRRCDGVCEGCAEEPATQVHHLTYRHFGDELLFELVGLCDACHEKCHAEAGSEAEEEDEGDPENDLEALLGEDAF